MHSANRALVASASAAVLLMMAATPARAAISWDGDAGTHWWYDKVNWRTDPNNLNDAIPPIGLTGGVTDTEISAGTGAWDQGFGVVYDPNPANDPNFANAGSFTFPSGFGSQRINQLYISRAAQNTLTTPSLVPDNKLTLRGDLEAAGPVILGRSSGMTGVATNALIVQESGTFKAEQTMDLGGNEQGINTNRAGYANGTYDYRGGSLEASQQGGSGLRLSAGGSGGPGGVGRFIMHNPATSGYVRTFDVVVAGPQGTSSTFLADGISTGVGVFEFQYENGGVRPIQVNRNMSINNGKVSSTSAAVRSARLDLVLHEAPCAGAGCVPANIGLFDVAFSQAGSFLGTGDLDGDDVFDNDRVFSNSSNTKQFYPDSRWAAVKTSPNFVSMNWQDEDFLVTSQFGSTLYRWRAVYSGAITWVAGQENNSVVQSINDSGGSDVVLIGHSSIGVGLPGDYNSDNRIDAGDYVIWRANEVANAALPNDNGVGNQAARYALWRSGFGNPGSASGLSADAVPEPGAIWLALVALTGLALVRRKH